MEYLGKKFGRLTPVEFLGIVDKNNSWLCSCECGGNKVVRQSRLKSGEVKSCGCLWHESSHGLSMSQTYNIYKQMKQRCLNENHTAFKNYGRKGVSVSEEWLESFENFYADMGECPEGMSLDRIDPNGDYCKENCRWADKSMQQFNRNLLDSNTSGKTGVNFNKKSSKWRAYITVEYKQIHLGYFMSFEDAVRAREEAELKYFGFIKE